MSSAVLELQKAVIDALKASAGVTAIVGQRVYDAEPRGNGGAISASFPLVSLGSSDELTEMADCIDLLEVSFDIDCWSRKPGFPEVRQLSHAVRAALHDANLNLPTNAIAILAHEQTRTFRDPDGLTSHAVLTFSAALEQN